MKKNFKKICYIFVAIILSLTVMSGILFLREKNTNLKSSIAYQTQKTSGYLQDLLDDNSTLETQYDLSSKYPLLCENQNPSDFCWIYSSLKSLESSLMVQTGEYYNFSEVGMAYLNYLDRLELEIGQVEFNTTGNFLKFVETYQKHGLIFESDFSNNNYSSMKQSNLSDYAYVADLAVKNINDKFLPYDVSNDEVNDKYFYRNEPGDKQEIIKRYIKAYGGLFAGIEAGSLYTDGSNNLYINDTNKQGSSVKQVSGDHAVCMIGWNDSILINGNYGGFLMMNSWGIGPTDYEYFYVPYNYDFVYTTLCGFICEQEDDEIIEIKETSAGEFATTFFDSATTLNNMFCYDESNIGIVYQFNVERLDLASVKIYSGENDVTNLFSVTYSNKNKKITILLNDRTTFYGGYFSIRFYYGEELKGIRSIYIYSGTELGYFKVCKYVSGEVCDSYELYNTFLSGSSVMSLYLANNKSYDIYFNLTKLNEYTSIWNSAEKNSWKGFNFSIKDAKITYSLDRSKENITSQNLISSLFSLGIGETYELSNQFKIQLKNLTNYSGCELTFTLTTESVLYNCEREYVFHVFLSTNVNATTPHSNSVKYVLNGGKNSLENVTRYPNYLIETGMTEIELHNPTKANSNFVGWYLTPDFSGDEITKINSSNVGDIALYAKWEDVEIDYFDVSLDLIGVVDYQKTSKSVDADLVYGDSIKFKFIFTQNDALKNLNYTTLYYFYVNDEVFDSDYLSSGSSENYFEIKFPDLESGDYTFSVYVVVVISNNLSVSETADLELSVKQKLVTFSFSDLTFTYDGVPHYPTVSVNSGSFYSEDLVDVSVSSLFSMSDDKFYTDVGTYNYVVSGLTNSNYYFVAEDAECSLVISPKEISVSWEEFDKSYDGQNHLPTYTVNDVVDDDIVLFNLTSSNFVNAGKYTVNIIADSISNKNYTISAGEDFEFEIKKANVTIILDDKEERKQTQVENRKKYTISDCQIIGKIYGSDDLGLTFSTLGYAATASGEYVVHCVAANSNYNVSVQEGNYKLTGFYYVYYQISNTKTYRERVEEGHDPVGVTKKQLKVPVFSKITYSDDYVITGDDIYVAVSYKDYTWEVCIGAMLVIVGLVSLIYYFKKRGNPVR